MDWIKAKDAQDMSLKAAGIIAEQIKSKPGSLLGLATGSTPLCVYEELIALCKRGEISFRDVRSVNLDEYYGLAPDNKCSYNYYMRDKLFSHVDILPQNTHLPNGLATDTDRECERYTALINELGRIDLQLLGIGMNGHIGFNEPGGAFTLDTHCIALTDSTRRANASNFAGGLDEVPHRAFTMGMRQIMHARSVLLIAGANKREIVQKAFCGPVTPAVPASLLQFHRHVTVISVD